MGTLVSKINNSKDPDVFCNFCEGDDACFWLQDRCGPELCLYGAICLPCAEQLVGELKVLVEDGLIDEMKISLDET